MPTLHKIISTHSTPTDAEMMSIINSNSQTQGDNALDPTDSNRHICIPKETMLKLMDGVLDLPEEDRSLVCLNRLKKYLATKHESTESSASLALKDINRQKYNNIVNSLANLSSDKIIPALVFHTLDTTFSWNEGLPFLLLRFGRLDELIKIIPNLTFEEINQVGSNGYSLLSLSIFFNLPDITDKLLQAGANPFQTEPHHLESDTSTPLHLATNFAIIKNRTRCLDLLLKHLPSNTNPLDSQGNPPAHYAAATGTFNVIEKFPNIPKIRNHEGQNLLVSVLEGPLSPSDKKNTIGFFLKKGLDPLLTDKTQRTPLDIDKEGLIIELITDFRNLMILFLQSATIKINDYLLPVLKDSIFANPEIIELMSYIGTRFQNALQEIIPKINNSEHELSFPLPNDVESNIRQLYIDISMLPRPFTVLLYTILTTLNHLHKALYEERYRTMKRQAEKKFFGRSPHHESVVHLALDEYLLMSLPLEGAANINTPDKNGNTPLHSALMEQKWDYARHFIEVGADLNIQNNDGDTPMHLILRFGIKDLIELAFRKKPNLYLSNKTKPKPQTPLEVSTLDLVKSIEDPELLRALIPYHSYKDDIVQDILSWISQITKVTKSDQLKKAIERNIVNPIMARQGKAIYEWAAFLDILSLSKQRHQQFNSTFTTLIQKKSMTFQTTFQQLSTLKGMKPKGSQVQINDKHPWVFRMDLFIMPALRIISPEAKPEIVAQKPENTNKKGKKKSNLILKAKTSSTHTEENEGENGKDYYLPNGLLD